MFLITKLLQEAGFATVIPIGTLGCTPAFARAHDVVVRVPALELAADPQVQTGVQAQEARLAPQTVALVFLRAVFPVYGLVAGLGAHFRSSLVLGCGGAAVAAAEEAESEEKEQVVAGTVHAVLRGGRQRNGPTFKEMWSWVSFPPPLRSNV